MQRFKSLALALALAATPALADDVTDTLSSALQAYEDGDIDYAMEELDYAKSLLKAMKTQALGQFLPDAPEGWTREIDTEVSGALGMMGGGTGAQAEYTNGSEKIELMIMANNPMVTAFGGMLANAAMLGMKVERVGREKFLWDDDQLTGLIDNRILIQAEGGDKDMLLTLVGEIDFEALENFGD
ncbi:MAG TPA: hypothetical protein DEO85_01995 [Maritimibacter sp.]|nr:hypothetical protein [Maritimibacter sp.]